MITVILLLTAGLTAKLSAYGTYEYLPYDFYSEVPEIESSLEWASLPGWNYLEYYENQSYFCAFSDEKGGRNYEEYVSDLIHWLGPVYENERYYKQFGSDENIDHKKRQELQMELILRYGDELNTNIEKYVPKKHRVIINPFIAFRADYGTHEAKYEVIEDAVKAAKELAQRDFSLLERRAHTMYNNYNKTRYENAISREDYNAAIAKLRGEDTDKFISKHKQAFKKIFEANLPSKETDNPGNNYLSAVMMGYEINSKNAPYFNYAVSLTALPINEALLANPKYEVKLENPFYNDNGKQLSRKYSDWYLAKLKVVATQDIIKRLESELGIK